MSLFAFSPSQLPFVALVIIIAFTLHEFAHAYAADRFGDPTPRSMGRVTLNPRVHLDLLGILLIFLVGFGWAKPVMIRPGFFKKPRIMSIIVALVGPLANLLLVFVGVLACYILYEFNFQESVSVGLYRAVALFLRLFIQLNLVLFLFNLLPLPPLDGYRILHEFLPYNLQVRLQHVSQWAFFIFLLIVFVPPIYQVTLQPVFRLAVPILVAFDSALAALFGQHGQLGLILLSANATN